MRRYCETGEVDDGLLTPGQPLVREQAERERITAELVGELERRAPDRAHVSLIADGDAQFLYEKFGFRPTALASVGMYRTV